MYTRRVATITPKSPGLHICFPRYIFHIFCILERRKSQETSTNTFLKSDVKTANII